ncbi:MAG TPA: DUF3634 family protein, partial [Polyangiaceae bacterium]|nr:DUF3634 family protein [Polyangiaceae bacterium]
MLYLALLALLCALPVLGAIRANQLFVLRVKRGRLTFLRGRIPQQLFDQIADLARNAPDCRLIATRDDGRPRLICRGPLDPG